MLSDNSLTSDIEIVALLIGAFGPREFEHAAIPACIGNFVDQGSAKFAGEGNFGDRGGGALANGLEIPELFFGAFAKNNGDQKEVFVCDNFCGAPCEAFGQHPF